MNRLSGTHKDNRDANMSHKNSKEKTRRNNGKKYVNKIIGLLAISIALVAMLYSLEPIMAINSAVNDPPPDVVIDDPTPDVTSGPTPPSTPTPTPDVTSGPTPPSTPTPTPGVTSGPTPPSTPTPTPGVTSGPTPPSTPTPTSTVIPTTPTPTITATPKTPTPTSTVTPKTPTTTSTVIPTTPTTTSTVIPTTPTPTSTVIPTTPTPTSTVIPTTPTGTNSPSNSGISEGNSGSGGILSIASKDASENLLKYEIVENNLVANRSIKYSFTMPEFAIYEVMINGQNNENQIPVKIESLLNTSKYALGPAPGIVYRNENVWIGTKKINYISVKFRAKNSWFKENNLNENTYLSKWNGTAWLILKTNMTGKDETYTYFETPKAGASPLGVFAISVLSKRTTNVNIQPTSTVIEPKEEIINPEIIEEVARKKTSGFDDMVLITSMILMLAYVIKKRYD